MDRIGRPMTCRYAERVARIAMCDAGRPHRRRVQACTGRTTARTVRLSAGRWLGKETQASGLSGGEATRRTRTSDAHGACSVVDGESILANGCAGASKKAVKVRESPVTHAPETGCVGPVWPVSVRDGRVRRESTSGQHPPTPAISNSPAAVSSAALRRTSNRRTDGRGASSAIVQYHAAGVATDSTTTDRSTHAGAWAGALSAKILP